MTLQRIGTKLFLAENSEVDPAALVPVFQRWIQRRQLPGLLIDVADYSHAHHGPGIMLICNEGDLSLDFGAGRPGLLYVRKREHHAGLTDGLLQCARMCLLAADLLQREQGLPDIRLELNEMDAILVDRLRAPNTEAGYDALRPQLAIFAYRLYGDANLTRISGDPRDYLCVSVRAGDRQTLAEMLARTAPASVL